MGPGMLFALTLPGLVVLLVALAAAEAAWARCGRRSPITRARRHGLSAGGLDVFSAALVPGRAVDLEEQRARAMFFDDTDDGAPPRGRIDLSGGVVRIDRPTQVLRP